VYGVASVAFRSLTGRLPFEGLSARMVAGLKLERPPPTLEEATGLGWPKKLEEFFALGLARDPNERFPSAEDARNHLKRVVALLRKVRKSLSKNA